MALFSRWLWIPDGFACRGVVEHEKRASSLTAEISEY